MKIEDFLSKLTGLNLEWVILGGYARDKYHGKEPKDLDIIVYNTGEVPISTMIKLEMAMQKYVHKEHEGSDDGGDGRIEEVLTYKIEGIVVDLIFWTKKHTTVESVINSFDYNINQYIYDFKSGVSSFLGRNEGMVIKTGEHTIPLERKVRIEQIARNLGWKISDDFLEVEVPKCPF